MDIKNFLKKIQGLNLFYKKLIIFGIIGIMTVLFGIFIVENFQRNLKEMQGVEILKETTGN
ncbi:hypothetical protein COY61_00835 [bacterium (Candidatus Gribaldobacteria) CG_4_10_14_0_8_um_filter_33_9]|uniref:Uncharacterized protein n=1 Tax=bacterium (Candidatus Gribaldobacteria) CG_4_10_14_0_8_um_filter_33_9 TaxID=2014266 RepID=A0A2M7RNI3_9BACT|nr:MAG: hypothetical protein COY61_00835 [bacterium (Candidatus Gribaldobacteria) CG_4_10_14_0_8_um_filter_33_9]